jgi:hypothetical protein
MCKGLEVYVWMMALLATSAPANISNTTSLENVHAICEAFEPRPSKPASIGSCTNIKVVTYWCKGAPTFKFKCYQIIFISSFVKVRPCDPCQRVNFNLLIEYKFMLHGYFLNWTMVICQNSSTLNGQEMHEDVCQCLIAWNMEIHMECAWGMGIKQGHGYNSLHAGYANSHYPNE